MLYKVNTIYPSFMGEVNPYGIGAPCTFIRLQGCNLRCYKSGGGACDTPEALDVQANCYTVDENQITADVIKSGNRLVCITGGEPLMYDIAPLIRKLSSKTIHSVVETNGSFSIRKYVEDPDLDSAYFIVDVKCPSTGMEKTFCFENIEYGSDSMFKFVVADFDDLRYAFDFIGKNMREIMDMKCYVHPRIFVGPCWGSSIKYTDLMHEVAMFGGKVGINMQAHKMVVMYDTYRECLTGLNIPKNL